MDTTLGKGMGGEDRYYSAYPRQLKLLSKFYKGAIEKVCNCQGHMGGGSKRRFQPRTLASKFMFLTIKLQRTWGASG